MAWFPLHLYVQTWDWVWKVTGRDWVWKVTGRDWVWKVTGSTSYSVIEAFHKVGFLIQNIHIQASALTRLYYYTMLCNFSYVITCAKLTSILVYLAVYWKKTQSYDPDVSTSISMQRCLICYDKSLICHHVSTSNMILNQTFLMLEA